MLPLRIGFQVWIMTIVLNAIYLGTVGMIMGHFTLLFVFFVLIAGVFFGLPSLVLLVQLIRVARKLPYSITARIYWISFWMSVSVWLFYSFLAWLVDGKLATEVWQFSGITIAAFATSMLCTRNSFRKVDGMNEHSIN